MGGLNHGCEVPGLYGKLCVLRGRKVSETEVVYEEVLISGYGRCESRVSICSAICAEGSRWWETGQTRSLTARRAGLVNRHFAQNFMQKFYSMHKFLNVNRHYAQIFC